MSDDRTDHHPHGTLEAAWDALEAGDVATARRRASRLDTAVPETLLLLAACCREEDDDGQAIELLRRACKADPEWATPELWLAEILAAQPETTEEALGHAERALDLAEEESEYLSALSLKAGLEAELGEVDEAKRTLSDLPPSDVVLGDPDLALEIADLHLALGDAQIARDRLRTLTAAEPELGDAWHALGCAASDLGDEREMREAWKRAWQLDAAPAPGKSANDAERGPDDALTDEEVGAIAEQALGELPERARALLRDVPVVVAEIPAEADVDAGFDPRALGLFSGTAYPDTPNVGGQPGLTQIILFRRNIQRIAGSAEELREEVRKTLLHETGHFFGMDEAALEGVGLE
jgi:predicted Zn-dependent protease with MMP-like domain/Tfp pilus assembly protein PilF